ncbi:hypothetical protein GCM10007350_18570 [Jeongeupia chitinilytica]|uniref:Uncharacterized protein n=1 Tax=Jeongeupia chitinilytica TaxID=1041641 RepID=A0ABQ3H0H1_9NEIS|nr:hypothetical protein GCM10007350_18570 [Jeongeupia chitinilytica]
MRASAYSLGACTSVRVAGWCGLADVVAEMVTIRGFAGFAYNAGGILPIGRNRAFRLRSVATGAMAGAPA